MTKLLCMLFGHRYVSSGVLYINSVLHRREKCIRCGHTKPIEVEMNNHKI